MKRASTKAGKHLIGRLIKSSKHQYIDLCFDLLKLFYDDLTIDYELDIIVDGGNLFYCLAIDNKELTVDDFSDSKLSVTDYIFELLAKISWEMITIDNIDVLYDKSIDEKVIRRLIKSEYSELDRIEIINRRKKIVGKVLVER